MLTRVTVPILTYLPGPRGAAIGRVVELTIAQCSRPGRITGLGPAAWMAIRDAYHVAVAVMPGREAGTYLEHHSFEMAVGPDLQAVNGDSLGLAVACGFVSLWSGQRIPKHVAVSATVDKAGRHTRVGAVWGAPQKVQAWREWVGESCEDGPLVLMHPDSTRALSPQDALHVQPVGTLEDALDAMGVDRDFPSYSPDLGPKFRRLSELEELANQVQEQRLGIRLMASPTNPWCELADRMRSRAKGIRVEQLTQLQKDAFRWAQLSAANAYLHGGDLRGVSSCLADCDVDESDLGLFEIKVQLELGRAIDRKDAALQERLCQQLSDRLARSRLQEEYPEVFGTTLGTMGRSFMHRRLLDSAEGLLERSLAFHQSSASLRHEAGRSRQYLAMLRRMKRDYASAEQLLDQARTELNEVTAREWSQEYANACLVFLNYEQARLLVAMERPSEALEALELAVSDGSHMGWWPLAGILRTQAWAHRQLGQTARADRCADRIQALIREVEHMGGFLTGLHREACGSWSPDGEVY